MEGGTWAGGTFPCRGGGGADRGGQGTGGCGDEPGWAAAVRGGSRRWSGERHRYGQRDGDGEAEGGENLSWMLMRAFSATESKHNSAILWLLASVGQNRT